MSKGIVLPVIDSHATFRVRGTGPLVTLRFSAKSRGCWYGHVCRRDEYGLCRVCEPEYDEMRESIRLYKDWMSRTFPREV